MNDIVIAGCGIAGAVAGLAALKKKENVLIIEKNRRESVGRKICGELITQEALQFLRNEFNFSIQNYPLKGLEVCSSSGHTLHVPEPLSTIDRYTLGQALLTTVMDKGAEVVCGRVLKPVGESCVQSVKTRDTVYPGKVFIDCSGASAVLRRKIIPFPSEIIGIAYKENIFVKEPVSLQYAQLIFDKEIVPSGYMWCFPKNEYELNVGVGGIVKGKASLKKILDKTLNNLNITVKRRETPGFGIVPLGGPLSNMVYPGLLVCGDAASHVNPLTGEGIAPAVAAGYYAGTTAAKAVKNDDISVEGLWEYNINFATSFGMAHAPLVLARNFLVSLSDEELTYFLENIVTGEDLHKLIKGKPPSTSKIIITGARTWRKPKFLFQLYSVFTVMNKMRNLYKNYPESPHEYSSWLKSLNSLGKMD